MMNKSIGRIAGVVAITAVLGAVAQEETVSRQDFEALQKEVSVLKSELTKQQQKELGSVSLTVPEGLEFGALVEVEAAYSSTDSEDESDLTLATVELSAGWQLIDWLRADLVFLYEEDDTEPMDVDQAILTFGNLEKFPLFLQVGKMYVPFGNLDSFFISDPIVLELAETLESAALLGVEKGGFSASLTAFNGDVETDGENQTDNFVAAASYSLESDNASLSFGGAWIRNIMDSDGLTGVLEDAYAYTYTSDDTGGLDAWATASFGPATLIVEYVKTLDDITVDGVNQGLKPSSLNLELGYALTDRLEVAAKVEKSRDVADWFPENRYGVVCSYLLAETDLCSTGLALEYMKEDFAAGAEDADLVTMQIAVEF
ncbi:MAG: LbtU family siderophore porin [Kiritimatiellales bacterium]